MVLIVGLKLIIIQCILFIALLQHFHVRFVTLMDFLAIITSLGETSKFSTEGWQEHAGKHFVSCLLDVCNKSQEAIYVPYAEGIGLLYNV